MSSEGKENEEKKTITVKGINEELFRRVKALAYQSGKTIGELTNRAYEMLLNSAQGLNEITRSFQQGVAESSSVIISGLAELELTGEEIKQAGKKVYIRGIERLTLKGVDEGALENIKGIEDVKELKVVGSSVNRIKLLAKCSNVKSVSFS